MESAPRNRNSFMRIAVELHLSEIGAHALTGRLRLSLMTELSLVMN
jgi:hypothetical protein